MGKEGQESAWLEEFLESLFKFDDTKIHSAYIL